MSKTGRCLFCNAKVEEGELFCSAGCEAQYASRAKAKKPLTPSEMREHWSNLTAIAGHRERTGEEGLVPEDEGRWFLTEADAERYRLEQEARSRKP
jgi:hypothetical protein